ncbi:MAG: formylmethanofuran dehydrogenase subunit C [Methanospirillaceae archaeon]|nr:formylmethanofuran dehydrogenase subunit C [Methanospirillaceae archaeon]
MDTVTLTMKMQPELYMEAETISPDQFAAKSSEEIGALPVYMGNEHHTLSDFFDISGNPGKTAADTKIVVSGDLTKVKYIGMKMTGGEVEVLGSPDMYVGAWMAGGTIRVKGNVDSFCGMGMTGGELLIDGNAKNYLGAAYRGDWRGMQGGRIVVGGNAGSDLALFMRGGEIIVNGNVDVHVATHAEGGTVVIKGNAKSRVGGQMVKGDIYVLGEIERMMPSYKYIGDEEIQADGISGTYQVWIGDLGERHGKRKGETIYGKIYLKVKDTGKAAESVRAARKIRLSDDQKKQIKDAFAGKEPGVQEVRAFISDTFGIDIKPMQVSRFIDEMRRKE